MLMDARETTLANGVRVATSVLPRVESVTFGIWVRVGARYESKKLSGASHFIEHLLFKGTRKRSAGDISRAIEGRGGYLNAFTQEENTCYYARVAYDQLWKALDVLCDMYLNSRFDKAEIDKERGVIVEEIMMYRDQPQHVVQEILGKSLWQGHPLGRPIIGTPATLAAMNRKTMLDFRAQKYVPANTLFAFAGRLDHDACVKKVAQFVGRLKHRAAPSCRHVTASVPQENVVLESRDIEQAHLALGIRLFGRRDKRRYALRVLSAVLGENMSSRLFQTVREKYGLAYSVHSSCHLYNESGALVVSAGLDKKRTQKAIELILRELVRLKEQPIGDRELKRAKDYVVGQLRLGLESTTHQMLWLGDNIMSHERVMKPEETIKRISSVTAEDVQKLALSVIKRRRVSLAMISPNIGRQDEPGMKKMLRVL